MKLKFWYSCFSSWRKTPPCSSQTAGFFVLWHQLTLFLCLHCDLIRITWAFSKFDRCCQWGSWVIAFFSNLSLGLLMCSCAFFVCVFVILLVMFGVFTFYSLIDPRRWICYSQRSWTLLFYVLKGAWQLGWLWWKLENSLLHIFYAIVM